MKILRHAFGIGFLALAFVAFRPNQVTLITGTLNPPDAASHAWAIMGTDTFNGSIANGAFEISKIKAGVYKVVIEGNPPYRNATRDSVVVTEGKETNLGEIMLTE